MRLALDSLVVLDAIERHGSFAAAAEVLHRVPSAVTYAVQKLEEDLGVAIFDRSGHRAQLTEAGRELLREGRRLLVAAGELEARVKRVATGYEVELRIAVDDLVPMDAWPYGATQDGIAQAIGISRAHAAVELKRQRGVGRIQELVAHVEGGKNRRKVYRVNPNPMTVSDEAGRSLPIVQGDLTTLKVIVFRCPHCSKIARVALRN